MASSVNAMRAGPGRNAGRANQETISSAPTTSAAANVTSRRSQPGRVAGGALLEGAELLQQALGGGRPLQDGGRARDLVDRLLDRLHPGAALQLRARLLVVLVHDALAHGAQQRVAQLAHAV